VGAHLILDPKVAGTATISGAVDLLRAEEAEDIEPVVVIMGIYIHTSS
jgi:hypothetical protein